MKLSQMQIAVQAELVARIHNSKWSANIRIGAYCSLRNLAGGGGLPHAITLPGDDHGQDEEA